MVPVFYWNRITKKKGIADNKAIEHEMISKSIQHAQIKIDEQVSLPINTGNSKE